MDNKESYTPKEVAEIASCVYSTKAAELRLGFLPDSDRASDRSRRANAAREGLKNFQKIPPNVKRNLTALQGLSNSFTEELEIAESDKYHYVG